MNTKNAKSKPEPRECECGCGEITTGSRFRQGHDARLKSALIKSALAGSKRAAQKLDALGWMKFLEAKRGITAEGLTPEKPKRTRRASKALQTLPEAPGGIAVVEPFRVVGLDVESLLPEQGSDQV